MRKVVIVMLGFAALSPPVHAQPSPSLQLPEIVVGGNDPAARGSETCVDVQIGGSRSYKCLNEKLQRQVDRVNPRMNVPPADARSSDIKIGVVNTSAVRQQYGSNYGVSVRPYRPPLPTYTSPIGGRR